MIDLKISRIFSSLSLFAVLFVLGTPSYAQAVLEEIVVTAQKREQNIQDVPISISRLSGQRLTSKFAGGEDILALAGTVPGLHVESSNGRLAPRFYMRGLGNADVTQAASQPVSIVFDEVPMEKAALKSFPLFDMDDIEVIRGLRAPCSDATPRLALSRSIRAVPPKKRRGTSRLPAAIRGR